MVRYLFLLFLLFNFSFGKEINIVTTIKPLADIVKAVGKEKVQVNYIIPPSVNFHLYEYKSSDMKAIYNADLFVFIGAGEPNIDKIEKNVKNKMKIISLKGLYLLKERDEHEDEIHPAVWLDPLNAKIIAKNVYQYLSSKDIQNKDFYLKNYQEFEKNIDEVVNYGNEKFKNLKNKYFVSYHYEFPYFVNRFGLIYLAEIEMGHGREPTPKHILNVISLMKKYNVKTVFTSKQFYNPKTADIVLKQTGAKVIFLDSQGETGDYISMMRFNIDKVYEGLKGEK